jgi:hypothetical protein
MGSSEDLIYHIAVKVSHMTIVTIAPNWLQTYASSATFSPLISSEYQPHGPWNQTIGTDHDQEVVQNIPMTTDVCY